MMTPADADASGFQVGLYGVYDPGTFYVKAMTTYSWYDGDSERNINFAGLAPGATFTKTWRLKNSGSCTWTTSYSIVFYSGAQMGAPTSVSFPYAVPPGQTVDLTVNMVAPVAEGEYRGFWILRNASGGLFGIGTAADIEKITREKLMNFHKQMFVPNNAMLIVVGDVISGVAAAAVAPARFRVA